MRTARAKVVNGKVVTKAKFPEGTKLLLVIDEIRAGRKIPMDRLMKLLPT